MLAQTDPQIFLDGLQQELEALPASSQEAYGAALCERHFADYLSFSRSESWGDPGALREAVDLAWSESLDGVTADDEQLDRMLAKCRKAVPDSEDFSTPLTDCALSLGVMVVYLVEFVRAKDAESVVQIASLARDIVDSKVQAVGDLNRSDPELEQKIATHPLMLSELRKLKSSLAMLKCAKDRDSLVEFMRVATAHNRARD